MEERQTNYTIMEGYELPSQGKIYDEEVNPHVELRSMTGRDEMKRLNPSTTPLKTLADIIEGCLIEKPAVHVYDMCLGDFEFLLHRLRIVSYGVNYKVAVPCTKCKKYVSTTVDLGTLKLSYYDKETVDELQTFELPRSKKKIKIKFLTPHLQEQAIQSTNEAKARYPESSLDFESLYHILYGIDTIDGKSYSVESMRDVILDLEAMDVKIIGNHIDKLSNSIGVDKYLKLECPDCKEPVETFFRFGSEFFGPSNLE